MLFGATLIAPVHAIEMYMPQQDAMMLCLQEDACVRWCKEHNTVVPYSVNLTHPANVSYITPVK